MSNSNGYLYSGKINRFQVLTSICSISSHFGVVDFWAARCGPCKVASPVIEQPARELARKVVFGKLNVDENPTTANAFGIQSIPTITIFKDGAAIDGIIGAASKSQIQTKLLAYIQS